MRHLGLILALYLSVFALQPKANATNVNFETEENGNKITRTYNVDCFDKIDNSTVGDITFTQTTDGSSSLKITGEKKDIERLKVVVIDGVLKISSSAKTGERSYNDKEMQIKISAPTLSSIKLSGVGDMKTSALKVKSLSITLSGTGNIKIENLNCTDIKAHISGVGDAKLAGKAETAKYVVSGVGSISAYDLEANDVTAIANGVGNIKCYASKSLHANCPGIGSIQYKGSPKEKKIYKSLTGNVSGK